MIFSNPPSVSEWGIGDLNLRPVGKILNLEEAKSGIEKLGRFRCEVISAWGDAVDLCW